MSAAAERAAIAAAGRDLIGARGGSGERRAAALLGRPVQSPPCAFGTLLDAPDWLRWADGARRRLAQVVALRSIAPALARSIDGVWLGALAEAAGDDAVDWAIAQGAGEEGDTAATLAPQALTAHGSAILQRALPPALRGYLATAASGQAAAGENVVAESLAFVRERDR